MSTNLDKARTVVAYTEVAVAGVGAVYLAVTLGSGIKDEIADRRKAKKEKKLAKEAQES